MTTKTDRKILMLTRTTQRLKRQKRFLMVKAEEQLAFNNTLTARVRLLMGKLRGGDGAKAPVPDGFEDAYNVALEYITVNKYKNGARLAFWKDSAARSRSHNENVAARAMVVDWKVLKLDEDLYDLEFVREWQYS